MIINIFMITNIQAASSELRVLKRGRQALRCTFIVIATSSKIECK